MIGAAYDGLAADYDAHLSRDLWMRRILWRHFDRLFHAGNRVVEVGCGTGIDTLHLAARGVRVSALDISPKMVARMREKLERAALSELVTVGVGDAVTLLAGLEGPFAGMLSSFAVLNTVDLHALARAATRLVPRGGRLVFHMLCPERPPSLLRRAGSALRVLRVLRVGSQSLPHLNLPAPVVYDQFFADNFVIRDLYGLGFVIRQSTQRWMPGAVLSVLGELDRWVGMAPWLASRGRFFVLDLERR